MRFMVRPKWPVSPAHLHLRHPLSRRLCFDSIARNLQTRASVTGGTGNSEGGSSFLVPGATVATILMLGILHARRLYDDKKVEEAKEKGIEFEFSPDLKATLLRLLPLRSISRFWGFMASLEIPVVFRPYIYNAWARAFHSNLEEIALPLDEYRSLQEFFVHSLKEGSRPIDPDPHCLVSPVDGTILRFGELKESGAMIEQVKGFSYSATSLLGANSFLPMIVQENIHGESTEQKSTMKDRSKKSWWRISLASPKMWNPAAACPVKGVFYCVIYLKPGDYHRVHSPIDWNVFIRRHFSGRLFPLNERATRTIRNLHVENERVVLEGQWAEGYMAIAAIGATTIGSIELFIEPELQTNRPRKKLPHSEPPDERIYEPEGVGLTLRKGEEVAAFNMGSTVVLVFQAPASKSHQENGSSDFKFCVGRGEKVRVGEALGRWTDDR
ncbi:phosphatidylserine decarboxylase proenzyme 1, mitochondrial isoform X1 [Telopea speciosissima]|uniref:phosphatidylserine decarboxylase proenzyme 1, mitochondrial isoform X1 n=1 Tax=Telopea speciosissima TaxID=54955 RepID=UPI001CC41D4B|nr:phosphatidylserine decarboxylase proenzyme 1, mitochondrial isoform X1 [Telopea speciosissima]